MNNNELQFLHDKLKCGEYDGTDVMQAWVAIEELIAIRSEVERLRSEPVVCPNCLVVHEVSHD